MVLRLHRWLRHLMRLLLLQGVGWHSLLLLRRVM
jgi:hypothetical protein